MPGLFDALRIRGITLKNRIGVSPMCQYSSVDGKATDWHFVHMGARAVGGAALVIAEATAVEPRGRISPQDAGLWSDEHVAPLTRITKFIKEQGAVPGIQLAHAGRKASCSRPWEGNRSLADEEGAWETIAPSAEPFGDNVWQVPKEMTLQDIHDVQEAFEKAAIRALEAGYQWLELHAAHGYLCHSFYSPISNLRTDEYGGSFENRIRFTVETLERLRRIWPDELPISVRLSCVDWAEGGWTVEDSVELSKRLKESGADIIDCSSGLVIAGTRHYPVAPGWQVPFAEQIRKEASMPTMAVGLITEPDQANDIIRKGQADIALLAREMLRDPYWPYRAAKALDMGDKVVPPAQYLRAI